MSKRVLVFSNFGYETGAIGGQTIKVKHIYKLFQSKKNEYGYKLSYFDTDVFSVKANIPINLFRFLKQLLMSTNIVFVGSKNNLLFLFPVIYTVSKVFKKQIDYIVVGGWLANFLQAHPLYIKPLATINAIYPQTKDLCIKLENEFGFNNVYQLNNFRYNDAETGNKSRSRLDLIYLARVSKQKGVNTLFKLAEKIDELNIAASIHIYGPIDPTYQLEFEHLLSNKSASIHYKGLVKPDKVYSVLVNYDLMLFPTRHFTEGFPGSILDAYITGMPVIASKWQYATEFIKQGETGLIAEFENDTDFIKKTLSLLEEPGMLQEFSANVRSASKKYTPDVAWEILKKNMFKVVYDNK